MLIHIEVSESSCEGKKLTGVYKTPALFLIINIAHKFFIPFFLYYLLKD